MKEEPKFTLKHVVVGILIRVEADAADGRGQQAHLPWIRPGAVASSITGHRRSKKREGRLAPVRLQRLLARARNAAASEPIDEPETSEPGGRPHGTSECSREKPPAMSRRDFKTSLSPGDSDSGYSPTCGVLLVSRIVRSVLSSSEPGGTVTGPATFLEFDLVFLAPRRRDGDNTQHGHSPLSLRLTGTTGRHCPATFRPDE